LAAVLLTDEKVEMRNIPEILDIQNHFEIFEVLGVKIHRIKKGHYIFDAKNITKKKIQSKEFFEKFSKLRGSLMVAGALLARFGIASLPTPGGDKIGIRPISTHIKGFLDLGAYYNEETKEISLNIIKSKRIILRDTSVTGTANLILASVLGKEKPHEIEIYNAASEPYIQQLVRMLNQMGANISGAGTNLIKIKSVSKLFSTSHEILPDMLEIGSFISLAVATGDGILIEGARKEHLGEIT
jgi:UDP-N-acetylglucosamine 1-carboxyvinyltransferase